MSRWTDLWILTGGQRRDEREDAMLRFIEMALAAFAVFILTGTNFYWFALGVPAGISAEEIVPVPIPRSETRNPAHGVTGACFMTLSPCSLFTADRAACDRAKGAGR